MTNVIPLATIREQRRAARRAVLVKLLTHEETEAAPAARGRLLPRRAYYKLGRMGPFIQEYAEQSAHARDHGELRRLHRGICHARAQTPVPPNCRRSWEAAGGHDELDERAPLEALAEFTEHMHAQAPRTRELN